MLGFTALSQAPLSQSTTSALALAFLATTLGQSTPGVMLFDAKALHTTASVSASTAANILFDAQAAITTADVIANTAISDVLYEAQAYVTASAATASFTTGTLDYEALARITPTGAVATGEADQFGDVDAKANITPTGSSSSAVVQDVLYNLTANIIQPAVTASFNTGTLDYTLTANITPTGAFATSTASDFGGVDAKANITPTGTSSNTSVNNFADVDAKANVVPSAVSAFLTIYIGDFADEDAQARAFIPPAVSVTNATSVDFSADSLITTGSTSALLNVSTLDALGGAKATFSGTLANLYRNLDDPVTVIFPYQDFADDYNTGRTLFVSAYEGSATVHIAEENYTVYIQEQQGSNTVYIAA